MSLVRFALHQEDALVPFPEQVERGSSSGWRSSEQRAWPSPPSSSEWLELIRDHVAASMGIEMDDFEYAPFAQRGGAGKAYQVFGERLEPLLDELNEVLAA